MSDTNAPGAGQAPIGTRAINLHQSDLYFSRFLDLYGRPNRLSVPERNAKANLSQALDMLAGPTYNQKLLEKGGRIDGWLTRGSSDKDVVEEIYLAAFSRMPTREESSEL